MKCWDLLFITADLTVTQTLIGNFENNISLTTMENLNLINFNFIFTITLQKKVMFDLVLLVLISTCTIHLEIFGHFRIARGARCCDSLYNSHFFFQTVIHPLPLSVFSLSFWVATDPTKTPYCYTPSQVKKVTHVSYRPFQWSSYPHF